jgi:hypothetical protein
LDIGLLEDITFALRKGCHVTGILRGFAAITDEFLAATLAAGINILH